MIKILQQNFCYLHHPSDNEKVEGDEKKLIVTDLDEDINDKEEDNEIIAR